MFLCLLWCIPLFSTPLVYDCFLFLNELTILDIRLHEMDPVVDKFVIVESTETFRGNPKPLCFLQNKEKFSQFLDKIIYVVVEEHFETSNPWDREIFQRNQILRGLTECQDEDVVIISDVDEIIRAEGVLTLASTLTSDLHTYVGVSQRYHSNFLNSLAMTYDWRGSVATSYLNIKQGSPHGVRGMKDSVPSIALGWHFTWQGGVEQDLYKLGAYSHAESDTPEERALKRLPKEGVLLMDIDETFPQYVRDHENYFI